MKLHHVIVASLLLLTGVGAQAASSLSGPNGVELFHGDSAVTPATGSFSDTWTLEVDEAMGGADIGISFSDIEIFSLNINGMNVTGDLDFDGSNDSWVYSSLLANDSYTITVSGLADGFGGNVGAYNTAFVATAAPAPVPLPPAALLFGSALIGMAAMRRKKAAKELVEA